MHTTEVIELAFLIQEHTKTTALLTTMNDARDATLFSGPGNEAQMSCVTNAGLVRRPIPMMLMRSMFQTRALHSAIEDYLVDLNQRLKDGYGIIIEAD